MNLEIFEAFEHHVDLDKLSSASGFFAPNRYHILRGGRGSGKSMFVAQGLVIEAYFSDAQILCARQYQNSIADSSMALIWEQIERFGLSEYFTKTKNEIVGNNGSRFWFRGLQTNVQSLKSVARIDFLFCDEAEAITEESWKVLTPSIRTPNARIIIVYNPRSILDPTHQRFAVNPPTNAISTVANFDVNPHFPDALEQERLDMLAKDPDGYTHVWLGEPVADSQLAIIPPKWARACIDIHKKLNKQPESNPSMGFDVSGGGSDPNATVGLSDNIVTHINEFRQSDPVSAAYDAFNSAVEIDSRSLIFDVIGVGSGTAQTLKEPAFEFEKLGKGAINIVPFDAGGAIENPKSVDPLHGKPNNQVYSNLKAQMWWKLRYMCQQSWLASQDMVFDATSVLSIDSDCADSDMIEKLIFEMCAPQREYNGSKLKVESKDKLKSRGIPSHNLADALIMSIYSKPENTATTALKNRLARRK